MYYRNNRSDQLIESMENNQNDNYNMSMDNTQSNNYNTSMDNTQSNNYNTNMESTKSNNYSKSMDNRKMHDECEKMMNYHSLFVKKDGTKFDGIVQSVEPDCVIILVAEDVISDDEDDMSDKKTRQYGYGNPRRFRRFVPRRYPYNNIGRVGLLPYPYYVPPYPFIGPGYPFI